MTGETQTLTAPSTFDQTEAKLKSEIARIEKISDPVDQLLEFKALGDAARQMYNDSKVIPPALRKFKGTVEQSYIKDSRDFGRMMGILVGVAAAVAGLGLVGVVVAAAGFFIGNKLGKKRGQHRYDKFSTEQKFATRMSEMTNGINAAISRLAFSLKQADGLKIVEHSPRGAEVQKAFPEIAQEFKAAAARKAFLEQGKRSPAAKRSTKLVVA